MRAGLNKLKMQAVSHGTTQDNLSLDKLLSFDIVVPPLLVQRRIADILSAYDDIIENNQKRIRVLEEMARSLYREWFVHFRFPGREKVRLVDSPLGKVLESWRVVPLSDTTDYISRGVAPKYANDGPELVLSQKCVREKRLSLAPARRHASNVPADKYVRRWDVLINSTGVGTLGRTAQVLGEVPSCTVDTHVTIVRPGRQIDASFFGMMLLEQEERFEAMGVGATGQAELARGRIAAIELLLPTPGLQQRFGKLVTPAREAVMMLEQKNTNLRTTRDLLLPRLLSGEIDVSNLPDPAP